MTPLQREALQMCLDYIETDAHERRHVRWKIQEALAEPQQEPVAAVAWQQGYDQGVADERISEANICIAGFGAKVNPARNNPYTSPPAQQEFVCSTGLCRYRKPLTDEEIESMWIGSVGFLNPMLNQHTRLAFARAIEAKHGIKGDA